MPPEAALVYAARWARIDPEALAKKPIYWRNLIFACMSAWNQAEKEAAPR
jgi:hypothetical protein